MGGSYTRKNKIHLNKAVFFYFFKQVGNVWRTERNNTWAGMRHSGAGRIFAVLEPAQNCSTINISSPSSPCACLWQILWPQLLPFGSGSQKHRGSRAAQESERPGFNNQAVTPLLWPWTSSLLSLSPSFLLRQGWQYLPHNVIMRIKWDKAWNVAPLCLTYSKCSKEFCA